jgi:hypothetical protein
MDGRVEIQRVTARVTRSVPPPEIIRRDDADVDIRDADREPDLIDA